MTTLIWRNLSGTIAEKQILSDCSGYCRPGEMLAIMGPSGAGKTTLLSILAGKGDPKLAITGNVSANNKSFTPSQFNKFGAFIYQNDTLHQCLTVKETILFVCLLKIRGRPDAEKRAEQLLSDFELKGCENTIVGGQIRKGISGGEKKRVCIAVEMVSKPELIVLDEPTSGLDSSKASRILKILKKLSKEGHTIIFTIHQPSYLLYSMLDRLLLLHRGDTIFQGPAASIQDYMVSLDIKIPSNVNLSDFFMLQISEWKNKEGYITKLNASSYKSHLSPSIQAEITNVKSMQITARKAEAEMAPYGLMIQLLFQREWRLFWRNPMKFGNMVGTAIIMFLIVGVIFINSIPSIDQLISTAATAVLPQAALYQLRGLLMKAQGTSFINITSNIMTGIFSIALAFPLQRDIYCKETTSKKYHPSAYFICKIIMESGSVIFGSFIYSLGGYWILGYDYEAAKFFKFSLTLALMALVGNSIGLLTGTLFQDAKKASSMAPMLLLPLMMFSGLYNRLDSIPVWIRWLQYISPFRYGLHMLLQNQYGDLQLAYVGGNIYDYRADLLISLGFWENTLVIVGLTLGFFSIAFIFLKKLSGTLAA